MARTKKSEASAKKVQKSKIKEKKAQKIKKEKVDKPKKEVLSPEKYFYLVNGQALKNIRELAMIMDELSDEVFYHHVNSERHDFANWINDVFEEAELAKQLIEAERNKEKNHYLVLRYIVKR